MMLCYKVQTLLKIALVTVRFIVGSFEKFGSFEKGRLKKKHPNSFHLAFAKNQREN